MKGLEPSTFCMAITVRDATGAVRSRHSARWCGFSTGSASGSVSNRQKNLTENLTMNLAQSVPLRARRLHERTDDPEQREEDSQEEHPSVSVSERPKAKPDEEDDPNESADSDSPPHAKPPVRSHVGAVLSNGWPDPGRFPSPDQFSPHPQIAQPSPRATGRQNQRDRVSSH